MTDSSMSLIYLSVWIPIKDQMQSNCLCGWVNFYRLKGFQVRSTAHMVSVQWISFGIIGNWRNRAECSVFPQSIYRSIYVGYQTALCEFTRTNTGDEQQFYKMSLYRYSNSKYSAVCTDNLFHLPFRSPRSFKVEISQFKKRKTAFQSFTYQMSAASYTSVLLMQNDRFQTLHNVWMFSYYHHFECTITIKY